MNEDGHTDVASAKRKLKTSVEDIKDIYSKLKGMSDEESLPSWWTDKITLSSNYLDKARDYITNPNESVSEGSFKTTLRPQKKDINKMKVRFKSDPRRVYTLKSVKTGRVGGTSYMFAAPGNRKEHFTPKTWDLANKKGWLSLESVNERKNPKREKTKKSFLKNLQKTEKTIRRIKQFAKSNQWGPISNFVEDDLVYDMTALKNDIDTIISLPIDESVNERSAISLNLWIKEFERLAKKNRMKPVDFIKKHISKRKGMDNQVVKDVLKHFQKKESVNEGSLDWEKNFKWANEKELKVIAKVVHMSNGIAPVIKMSKKKDFKPFIKKAAQKGLGESVNEAYKKIGKKVIKYKDKTGSWNWDIESGIDTDVLDGKTPKIMINYQHKDEKGFPKSGGNFFWLKEKDGTPYTPQKAKAFLNKIAKKNTIEKFLDSIKPSGAGNLVVYKGGKFVRESVNEAVEPTGNIKKVLDVAKNKQAKKIGGTLVDLTTSSMMTQVWDKVNDSSKEKMNKMNTKQLIRLILKLWDRMGTPRV
jgi:hypothetical protein